MSSARRRYRSDLGTAQFRRVARWQEKVDGQSHGVALYEISTYGIETRAPRVHLLIILLSQAMVADEKLPVDAWCRLRTSKQLPKQSFD